MHKNAHPHEPRRSRRQLTAAAFVVDAVDWTAKIEVDKVDREALAYKL